MAAKKILIIDDDKAIVKLVKAVLEQENYRVRTAFNGCEGLKMLKKESADLIILSCRYSSTAER